jgi:hypothetical protein
MDISAEALQFRHLVTPQIGHLSGRELAQAAVRHELIAAGYARSAQELTGLLPLARSLRITMAEAQRLTGYARQTLYSVLDAEAVKEVTYRDMERVARLLSIALAATSRELPLAEAGEVTRITPSALVRPAQLLESQGFAELSPHGRPEKATLAPTELLVEWLRIHASARQLDNRAPGYAVYLKVDPDEMIRIDEVAREIVGLDEAAVLPESTAPSVMEGPELAINIRATDQRSALRTAGSLWNEIRSQLKLEEAPMRVADLHLPPVAPAAPSQVLDAFIVGLSADLDEETANRIRGERERYVGGEAERVLAARCLTYAARQMRRALGREDADRMPTITDGDSAFEELMPVNGLAGQSPKVERIREPLLAALKLAGERLGPFRGGELAAFKAPGERPKMAREVAPSKDELAEMARLSGIAIAASSSAKEELVALLRAVAGLPTASRASTDLQ